MIGGRRLDREARLVEDHGWRIDRDRHHPAGEPLEHGSDRSGDRPPDGPVEDEDGERRQSMERCALARLGRHEVAALLAREAAHDDAANAHRSGPGQGFGVDPGSDDEDRPGQPDIERRRAQPSLALVSPLAAE